MFFCLPPTFSLFTRTMSIFWVEHDFWYPCTPSIILLFFICTQIQIPHSLTLPVLVFSITSYLVSFLLLKIIISTILQPIKNIFYNKLLIESKIIHLSTHYIHLIILPFRCNHHYYISCQCIPLQYASTVPFCICEYWPQT